MLLISYNQEHLIFGSSSISNDQPTMWNHNH
jgi:uncharacterized protein YaeQ